VIAILAGERDVQQLVKLRDPRIKASAEEIKKSLQGIWKEEYLFLLEQAYTEYEFYQRQMNTCNEKIKECLLLQAAKVLEGDITSIEIKKKRNSKRMS